MRSAGEAWLNLEKAFIHKNHEQQCVVIVLSCPSHNAITLDATPGCSRYYCRAQILFDTHAGLRAVIR